MSEPEDCDPIPPRTMVVCVLKTGGEYRPEHVSALYRGVQRWGIPGTPFLCVTDDRSVQDCHTTPLLAGWSAWWAKMEVFLLHGPCLYLDLDSVIVGPLQPLLDAAQHQDLALLRDVYRGRNNPLARQSSVMMWRGDMRFLHDAFRLYPPKRAISELHSDQEWIETSIDSAVIQDIVPGACVSFKADLRSGPPGPGASVVVFHGHPRPWQQEVIRYGD